GGHEAELLEPPLEEFPCAFANLAATALLLVGHRAKEDVAIERRAADLAERGFGLGELCPVGRNAQRFLPAIRAISACTRRSTIAGRCCSSHCASIGRSMSRTRPSSDVSPDRTICGWAPGSASILSAAS